MLSQLIGNISIVWKPSCRTRTRWSKQGSVVPPCMPIAWVFAIILEGNLRFRPRWEVLVFLHFQRERLTLWPRPRSDSHPRPRNASPRTCQVRGRMGLIYLDIRIHIPPNGCFQADLCSDTHDSSSPCRQRLDTQPLARIPCRAVALW